MSQQTKHPHLELSTTGEPTQPLPPVAVNRTGQDGQHSTRSRKTVQIKPSTKRLSEKLSNPTLNVEENARIAANILTATVPTLIKAGLVQKKLHSESGNMVLVFPSTLWTDELRMRCEKDASCGFPTPSGYKVTCGDHFKPE